MEKFLCYKCKYYICIKFKEYGKYDNCLYLKNYNINCDNVYKCNKFEKIKKSK
jgi:hypothetical protein